MRVLFVTQDEPLYIPRLLDRVLQQTEGRAVAIAALKTDEEKRPLKAARYYLGFWGPITLGRMGMRFVGARLSGLLGVGRTPRSLSRVATAQGVKYMEVANVNSQEFLDLLKREGVDVIVSIAANQIFRKPLLETPHRGCINVHAGLLPHYRGFNPSFWVLKNKEAETGVTVHFMTEALDAGDILVQERIQLDDGESWHSLQMKVVPVAAQAIVDAITMLESGTVTTRPNEVENGSLFKKPRPEDGQAFRAAGGRFL